MLGLYEQNISQTMLFKLTRRQEVFRPRSLLQYLSRLVAAYQVLGIAGYCAWSLSYGTNMADAVAPVSFTASRTLAKTGFPRCVSPAFFGFVPPTTLVPEHCQLWSKCRKRGQSDSTVVKSLLRVKARTVFVRTRLVSS